MPRASKQKTKGGVQTSPKNVAATVRSLRRCAELQQAAVKQLLNRRRQKKNAEQSRVQLATAHAKLEEEKLDAEAILRQAESSGMQTRSLKEAIEFASEALSVVQDTPTDNNPPNPKPGSRSLVEPDLSTVVEGEEEEATMSNPIPVENTAEKLRGAGRRRMSAESNPLKSKSSMASDSNPDLVEGSREADRDKEESFPETRSRRRVGSGSPILRSEKRSEIPPKKSISKPSKNARFNPNPVEDSDEEGEEENPATRSKGGSKTKDRGESIASKLKKTKTGGSRPDPTEDPLEEISKTRSHLGAKPKITPPKNSKSDRSKKIIQSDGSSCSNRSKAQKDLNEAELSAKAIRNNIESLMAQLEAQKLALKVQEKNAEIHRDRVLNESEGHSRSGSGSIESERIQKVSYHKSKVDETKGNLPHHGKTDRGRSRAEEFKIAADDDETARVDEWVDKTRTQSHMSQNEQKSAFDELSTAAAAVLRHQLLQTQKIIRSLTP